MSSLNTNSCVVGLSDEKRSFPLPCLWYLCLICPMAFAMFSICDTLWTDGNTTQNRPSISHSLTNKLRQGQESNLRLVVRVIDAYPTLSASTCATITPPCRICRFVFSSGIEPELSALKGQRLRPLVEWNNCIHSRIRIYNLMRIRQAL